MKPIIFHDGEKAIVVRTDKGWEPAFWCEARQQYEIESGFAVPTAKEAIRKLLEDRRGSAEIAWGQLKYAAGYAYACGYYD